MGWWKCSRQLELLEISVDLKKSAGRGDSKHLERMYLLQLLLSESAEGTVFCDFKSIKSLSKSTEIQCSIVWDRCINHNVLRKDGNGYSAREWMQEQGLLPDEQEQKTISQKPAQEQPRRQYEHKEQVRPNVRLSRSELDALRNDYSDEKVAQILDTLSKYKTEKGKYYASDYDAIRRWVCRAVEESATINQPEEFDEENFKSPFPDWIYGRKDECHDKG